MNRVLNPEDAILTKTDGSKHHLEVQFGRESVLTFDTTYTIDAGDVFERKLSNGGTEYHEVVDATFTQGLGPIESHYSCNVRKRSALAAVSEVAQEAKQVGNTVFVVHGHDEDAKGALKSLLQNIGLRFLSWGHVKSRKPGLKFTHEAVRTGIEEADALVVLFTPDELASRRSDLPGRSLEGYQPRPNVIFEAGWAFGAHTDKTVIVEVGGLHRLSDIDGLQTIRMKGVGSLNELANELRAIGLPVDLSDTSWNDVENYPGLFQQPPELPATKEPENPGPDVVRGDASYDDETLLELQRDKLPVGGGFYTFSRLDDESSLPPGTAERFAVQAAKLEGRLEGRTKLGVRLGRQPIFKRG